jgi:iron-sulfur cluster assembly accessory protein
MAEAAVADQGLVRVSESAAKRIVALREQQGDSGLMLRVAVEGGGCSGFTYKFSFEGDKQDDDLVVERDGAAVLIDAMSLPFMAGSEIDFIDELMGAYFSIKNPNATASCGCGTSFSVG